MSPAASYLDFLRSVGMDPHDSLDLPDGKLERFRVAGDKRGSKAGWSVFHAGPPAWGICGSHKTKDQHVWKGEAAGRLSREERARWHEQRRQAEIVRRAEQFRVWEETAKRAALLWARARPAHNGHPYLVAKGVPAYGLRLLGDRLLVPAYGRDGLLKTIQFIDVDGTKRFLTGGQMTGSYLPIGRLRDTLLVCEGYSTAASVHMATQEATAVAFSANNLARVAVALRSKYPKVQIVICADDDRATPGNPGLTAATEAARAVGGVVVRPDFPLEGEP